MNEALIDNRLIALTVRKACINFFKIIMEMLKIRSMNQSIKVALRTAIKHGYTELVQYVLSLKTDLEHCIDEFLIQLEKTTFWKKNMFNTNAL